jgi:hypothetical protein
MMQPFYIKWNPGGKQHTRCSLGTQEQLSLTLLLTHNNETMNKFTDPQYILSTKCTATNH